MKENIILKTDAYKQTHWLQYPRNTTKIYSYLESRGGLFSETVFFGLQMLIKKHFEGVVVEQWMIEEADEFCKQVFGADYFNRAGWQRIVDVHGGKLPIIIKAVREGTVVPTKHVLVSVENTDDQLPFLTNFVETILMQVWYPTTVCTLSYEIKKLIARFAKHTGGNPNPFHLNDFGFRGVSSTESAGIGGCAHLVNFLGTDTLEGIRYAMKYYGAKKVCGHSVMASEHSTTTIYLRENELRAYETFINKCPTGILSLVSDSYDIYHVCEQFFGKDLKDKILKREGKLVVRPDSGEPSDVTVKVLRILWDAFGGTVNEKGYKVLNPKVGVIYGDGINYDSINSILFCMELAGFSTDCIVFGMGGALLQQVNRDTQKFAFKCSAAEVDGQWRSVFKEPITDHGKSSKKGRLGLINNKMVGWMTYSLDDPEKQRGGWTGDDLLEVVFENGELKRDQTFDDIRNRAKL